MLGKSCTASAVAPVPGTCAETHKHARHPQRQALRRETLEVQRRVLGAEHPETLRSMNNLANLLNNTGQADEAEVLYKEGGARGA